MTGLGVAAVACAAAGLAVFPCRPGGKVPLTANGFHDATADADRVAAWWTAHPTANIATPTGAAAGFWVLDVDQLDALDELTAARGPLPATKSVVTGGGGLHMWFAHPRRRIGNRAGVVAGIDVRGDGGYVILPPSRTDDEYRWRGRMLPVAAAPAWLLEIVEQPAPRPAQLEPPLTVGERERSYAAAALASESATLASTGEGGRNAALNTASFNLGQLVGAGVLHRAEVEGAVLAACAVNGLLTSERRQTEATLRSGLDAGAREPRAVPASTPRASRPRRGDVPQPDLNGRPVLVEAEVDGGPGRPGERRSQAQVLMDLATARYTFAVATTGEPFAVPVGGPRIARMLRGDASLRAELAHAYYAEHDRVASTTALADALRTLEGRAHQQPRQELALRIAEHDGCVVLDLGRPDGAVVVIDAGGWRITDSSPVLFRRTALTSELALPERGGRLDELRGLLNVTSASWPVLLGFLVAALVPSIPHPVLLLTGEQGTGKTTAARMLVSLIDPSGAPTRTVPRDVEGWAVQAAGSWVVCLDNLSQVPAWLSDALCRAATGDGLVRRMLYTDAELSVLAFRRVVMLTAIDAGALRGDLADRLVTVELERIDPHRRRLDADLEHQYRQAHPQILGALLDLLACVLAARPAVEVANPPRMADFALLLAAMDAATGTDALDRYRGQGRALAAQVVDDDPVAAAIRDFVLSRGEWTGTAAQLAAAASPEHPGRDWPASGQAMAAVLKRSAPGLRAVGIEVEQVRVPGVRSRGWVLSKVSRADAPEQPDVPGQGADQQLLAGTSLDASAPSGHIPTRGGHLRAEPSPSSARPRQAADQHRHAGAGTSGTSGTSVRETLLPPPPGDADAPERDVEEAS